MPDAAIPTFQTVTTTGLATLEVEAIIKALGLSLTEKETKEVINTIVWKDAANVAREEIEGRRAGANTHIIDIAALGITPTAMQFVASSLVNEGLILCQAGGITTQIIDNAQRSSFLQLPGPEHWTCNFGKSFVTYPGASAFSNVSIISHGIGSAPATIQGTVASSLGTITCNTPTLSTFAVQIGNPYGVPGAGATQEFFWFAIG